MSGIRPGDRVTLHYRLDCNGEQVTSTFEHDPETFTLGGGELAGQLEGLLLGLQAGDHRGFDLAPGEAFGERHPALLQEMPRAEFPAGLEPTPGSMADFPLPNGQVLSATILDADESRVKLDFNHPLAGLPVRFEVRIIEVEHA